LIDSGADVNEVVSNTKSTPLHLIARCYNIDSARSVIQLLLDANAHIDCIDKNGLKPEDVAWTRVGTGPAKPARSGRSGPVPDRTGWKD